MFRIWLAVILFGVLTTLSSPPAGAQPKDVADRCLTTLYNYPAGDNAAKAPNPVVSLEPGGLASKNTFSDKDSGTLTAAAKK
jgi:hypothetical protein